MDKPTEQNHQDVKKHVRSHLIIAAAVTIGTILTIWTSQTNFGSFSLNVAMTIAIAALQAFMVAGFFMHLLSEKKMIYSFLIFTAVFFVVQMGVTIWARSPGNEVQIRAHAQ